jgi:hypothetical protein
MGIGPRGLDMILRRRHRHIVPPRLCAHIRIASWWQIEHVTARERTPCRHMLPRVIGRIGAVVRMDRADRMAQTGRLAAWLPYDNPAVG